MTEVQQLRKECLLQLYGSGEIAIGAKHVYRAAQRAGIATNETAVGNALFFLRSQGFAEVVVDQASGESRYRITSAGMIEHENNAA